MSLGEDPSTTQLLNRFFAGDPASGEELARLVYRELHRLAGAALSGPERPSALDPTGLVHEAWLRLAGRSARFENRRQFYGLTSRVMRSVLVDQVRARGAQKRGGERERIALVEAEGLVREGGLDFLDLHAALQRLEAMDPDLHELVELRFFAGLDHPDIAALLGVSLSTVERRWRLARAWLRGELGREG